MRLPITLGLVSTLALSACGGGVSGGKANKEDLAKAVIEALAKKDKAAFSGLYLTIDGAVSACSDLDKDKDKLAERFTKTQAKAVESFDKCAALDWSKAKPVETKGGDLRDPDKRCPDVTRLRDIEVVAEVDGKKVTIQLDDPIKVKDSFFLSDRFECEVEGADAAKPAEPAAEPAKPAEPAMSRPEPDDKELERTPGLTPVLPLAKVKAPPAVEGLAGKPGESPAMGPDDAIVKVFIFSDFQCPVCRRAVEPMKKLARTFPEDVQVIFKHHALPSHSRAEPAARASLAAFRQGRFWEMHDKMFDNQQGLDDATLRAQAVAVGCDGAQYDKDLADPALAEQVAYESAQAQAIEAQGTPAYIINGDLTVGWGSYLGVESQVRRAIEDAKKLLAEGTPRAEVAKKATAMKNEKAAKILFGQ